jgi:putative cardiolipin synthase
VRAAPFVRELLQRALVVRWARTELVYDDPAKTLAPQQPGAEALLLTSLLRTMGEPRRGLDLVSPYFVPGEAGTAKLVHLAQSGVQVRVLTNSLAATDVTAVHAGYARRREALLRGGVRLYEFKPSASPAPGDTSAGGLPGSGSGAALHAKTLAVDAERIFVGSFNFDPRSALLNTEMGLVVHDPALGQALARAFDTEIPLAAYEVRLADDGRTLQWAERGPGGVTLHDVEPGAGLLRRAGVGLMSWLPIEWLL